MSSVTVTYTLAPKRSQPVHRVPKPKPRAAPRRPTDRTARMLALAHYIDRLIDDGVIADYAEAAKKLVISRARVTQVMDLVLLAPGIQEGVLLGGLDVHERQLRMALHSMDWDRQRHELGEQPEILTMHQVTARQPCNVTGRS